jgi:pyrophosphate--fructose-6-phosphate 1-phosphotransferase
MRTISPLQQLRLKFQPKLPNILQEISSLVAIPKNQVSSSNDFHLKPLFPKIMEKSVPFLEFISKDSVTHTRKKVGVVLSGGQAPGGHNVISGLFDALKKLHPDSKLYGFCNGPGGIIQNQYIEITDELLAPYRNQGGFDLLGSGRTKIETIEQFTAAEVTVKALDLDGLVIIGGDDSNTNATLLAEYFLKKDCKTVVVGVPKTIDGDLKNEDIEVSFGFDTACKIYSEIIGNIARDSLSAKKYYHFIKLMGRSASHVTLECAFQTHPNMALISEEIEERQKTLSQVIEEICDMICTRASQGKDYGVILIPEGVIEFIPEFKLMILELNALFLPDQSHAKQVASLHSNAEKFDYILSILSHAAQHCFQMLSDTMRAQLLLDRDPHGNIQVSKIETERFFIEMVQTELKRRKESGAYTSKFNAQAHFCGYEGRSGMPSNFDVQYCYALGYTAALLVQANATGYIACVQNLTKPIEEWAIGGKRLTTMIALEHKHGKEKPVITKALVDLKGKPFAAFKALRDTWGLQDDYCYPGPIQFSGPPEVAESIPLTLVYEQGK